MPTNTIPVTITDMAAGRSAQATLSCLVGAYGFSGATTFAPGYPAAGGDQVKAASIFDGYVGVSLAASLQKFYLSEGQWLTAVPKAWAQLTEAGCRFWLCVKPDRAGVGSPAIGASERSNMAAAVKLLKPYGLILWNEFNGLDPSGTPWFGGSQPAYSAYVPTYGPAAADLGIPVAICADISYVQQAVVQMQQITDPSPFSAGLADWYGNHYLDGQYPDQAPKGQTASVFGLFDQWGIPPGLGEWGMASGTKVLTASQWDAYTGYLYSMMWSRLVAGGTIADVAYYSGQTADGVNNVTSGADFKVPAIQRIATLGQMMGG